jgi:hypothetical protein
MWVDNTGDYQVQGKLIAVLDGKVRLLKVTGRTTTVPFNRLSTTDQLYVKDLIAKYGSKIGTLAAK